jgi:dTDP-glucose 4,6-dehydratase
MTAGAYLNVLVCGGSGFIGSHFARRLYEQYPRYRIFNLDLLTYAGQNGNLDDLAGRDRYTFIHGSICDATLLARLFSEHRFAFVVNFAAESHVDRSIFNSYAFIQTNVNGVHSLIDACREYQVPRFVQISTDEVYGDVLDGHSDEDAPIRPSSPYSSSKAAGDLLVQAYMRTHDLPAIILRGANNFGFYQYPEKLIPLAIINMIRGEVVPVHGTGRQVRNWLHVADFCSAIDLAMHHAPDFTVYNVSDSEWMNIEVLQMIAGILDKDLDACKVHTKDRPGGDWRYAPDSARIRTALGWSPQHRLDQSLEGVVRWYQDNECWWQSILSRQEVWDHYQKQFQAQYF